MHGDRLLGQVARDGSRLCYVVGSNSHATLNLYLPSLDVLVIWYVVTVCEIREKQRVFRPGDPRQFRQSNGLCHCAIRGQESCPYITKVWLR